MITPYFHIKNQVRFSLSVNWCAYCLGDNMKTKIMINGDDSGGKYMDSGISGGGGTGSGGKFIQIGIDGGGKSTLIKI